MRIFKLRNSEIVEFLNYKILKSWNFQFTKFWNFWILKFYSVTQNDPKKANHHNNRKGSKLFKISFDCNLDSVILNVFHERCMNEKLKTISNLWQSSTPARGRNLDDRRSRMRERQVVYPVEYWDRRWSVAPCRSSPRAVEYRPPPMTQKIEERVQFKVFNRFVILKKYREEKIYTI